MASKDEVQSFLQDFKVKANIFEIVYRDERRKNTQFLLDLELSPLKRREIIDSITSVDYSEGPLDDHLHGIASLWVFGKKYKQEEIYIKISMGYHDAPVICISFHAAAHPMKYPFKQDLK